jgi:hypothetical protein
MEGVLERWKTKIFVGGSLSAARGRGTTQVAFSWLGGGVVSSKIERCIVVFVDSFTVSQ